MSYWLNKPKRHGMDSESNAAAELQESLNCTFPCAGHVAPENPSKASGITPAQKSPASSSSWGGGDSWLRLSLCTPGRERDFGSLFPKTDVGGTAGELRPLPPSLYTNHVASPLLTMGSNPGPDCWESGAQPSVARRGVGGLQYSRWCLLHM